MIGIQVMMNKIMHIFLSTGLLLWLVCLQIPVVAQQLSRNDIAEKFDAYRSKVYYEKIYLETDKPTYLAGEIAWFSITYVDAFNHHAASLSKVAYIEILDAQNKPVIQTKVALNAGSGNGSQLLPVNLPTGFYKIRAYTNWMKNFDASYYFETSLSIINSTTDGVVKASPVTGSIKGTCIAEGGSLVQGLPGKVVFKLVDEAGKGIEAIGTIELGGGDSVQEIKTESNGYGSFEFIPTIPDRYKAIFTLANGEVLTVVFPPILQQGYTMQLNTKDAQNIELKVYTNLTDQLNGTIMLFAHTRHTNTFNMQANFNNGVASFTIDQAKLVGGITHFTVFNVQNQPLLQRLYFKYPPVIAPLALTSDHLKYSPRSPVSIQLKQGSGGNDSHPVQGSLSVYRLDSIQGLSTNTIESYLNLSADLADRIDNPELYFTETNSFTKSALDNLMITQNWKRFNWNDILSGKMPTFNYLPEFVGHFIEGKMVANQDKPTNNLSAYIASVGKRTQVHMATTKQDNKLLFEVKDFYNNGEMVVQSNPLQDSNYTVEILEPFAKEYSSWKLPAVQPTTSGEADLLQLHRSTQVQQAYVANKVAAYLHQEDSSAFFLNPEATYILDNFVRFTSMEDILREYVAEVMVTRRRGSFQLSVYDNDSKVLLSNNPLVILDGVPMFDMDKVMALDPIQLSRIDIVAKKYYFKEQLFYGIILLSTYQGKLPVDYIFDEKATVIQYEGLQKERLFYSPDYATPEAKASRLPDYRNVLYWSGNLTLDAALAKSISFYTGDLTGKYVAVWSGIHSNGQPFSQRITFVVQ